MSFVFSVQWDYCDLSKRQDRSVLLDYKEKSYYSYLLRYWVAPSSVLWVVQEFFEIKIWDFGTKDLGKHTTKHRTSVLKEAVDTDLFRDIRRKILPAKAEEVAKVFSTAIPGDQVDTELCSKSREKIFEERKDTTLSGKLIKDPPVRGQFGEAFIELREGYKAKKQRPYENHGHKHEILRKIIERNLREFGWLERCMTSEWCCAPFTVPKPPPADQNTIDGWRIIVDFRNLNAETKADSHPLPLIEEEIAKRARGRLFSVLDLRHGFHQMPLRKDSRPLTCMCTPCGPVQWTVMPMGLKNAPSFFQRMMEDVLFTTHPELRAFVSVYIDDIIIATEGEGLTEAELVALHEKQLNQVLDILDANQLICGPKKGKLFLKSVKFCGSLLENGTRRPSPGKLVAIQKWKRPETITELRGFLGCCNFYHTFVPNYAKFAAPLTELLKVGRDAGKAGSKVRVKWTDECEEAFHHLKAALCEVATLHVPQFDRPFYIRTDASRYAIGAVLEQVDEATGDHYPLAFWSRKLAPRQMQWSPREQETYAIICALKKYQSWVGTNRVEVLTDHRSLEYWATEHIDTVASPWEGPFAVTARLGENRWRIRVDVSREIDVSGDRLKREIPSPKDRVKPLFWTAKHLSDRVIEGGKYELKRIVEARRDAKGEWEFLCEWRGFDSSHNNWEPAQSFVHGYTKGFIDFLKKHPEIGVLLTDCLSKPDRQVESDGKRPVVNRDPAFYGPQQPHSRADPSIPPPAVRPAQEPNEDQASSSAADLQRPSRTRARPDRLVVTCIRAWPN